MITKLKNIDLDTIMTSPPVLWIISITIAVTMWFYVTSTDEAAYITREFSVPVEYSGLSSQTILRDRLSEVYIKLRGPETSMLRLNDNDVTAYIDARNYSEGKRYNANINVNLPPDIMLVSCTPSQTTVTLARSVTRLMNVETVLPASIPEGYYVENVEILPKEVAIKGAEDDIAKVASIRITPTIEELQAGREQLMAVKFAQSEPFESPVALEPAQVRFKGVLVRGLPKKRVPVNVKLSGTLDSDYEVRSIITDPSEVQVEGSAEDLASFEGVDTEIIDVSAMKADSVIIAPLKHPEAGGVSLTGTSSVKVSIMLSEARAERMLNNIPVEFINTEESWISSPATVSVSIEGRPSLIENFGSNGEVIRAYADMENIFMAPVTLPVKAEILSGDNFSVVRVEPANVTVNTLAR